MKIITTIPNQFTSRMRTPDRAGAVVATIQTCRGLIVTFGPPGAEKRVVKSMSQRRQNRTDCGSPTAAAGTWATTFKLVQVSIGGK